MEGSYFPENKDLAHKIMMDLSNKDLVKVCSTNKRLHALCNDYPDFWRKKFIKDYGEHAAKYKPVSRTWKNHYMMVFIDLERFKKNPIDFLLNIAWHTNIDDSYFLDYSKGQKTPLKEAPDWVINNLYLLNLGNLKVREKSAWGKIIEYESVKPIDLLKIYGGYSYLYGFKKNPDYYSPRYVDLQYIKVY